MAENNQNSLVTKIATYGSFIAIASFVILFISIFLKFSFNIEFTATIMNCPRHRLTATSQTNATSMTPQRARGC